MKALVNCLIQTLLLPPFIWFFSYRFWTGSAISLYSYLRIDACTIYLAHRIVQVIPQQSTEKRQIYAYRHARKASGLFGWHRTGVDFISRNNFTNLGSFAEVSVLVQSIIPCEESSRLSASVKCIHVIPSLNLTKLYFIDLLEFSFMILDKSGTFHEL